MDPFDAQLLELIQTGVPLIREPFAQIAGELGTTEPRILERVDALSSEDGIIREISGVFDTTAMGYTQALVAFGVPEQNLDESGRIVSEHPGVSHCYGRTGRYNLWFTLAVSPASKLGLEQTAAILTARCNAPSHVILPTLKRYKLDVRFSIIPGGEPAANSPAPVQQADTHIPQRTASPRVTEDQVRAVRALQTNLPHRSDPFSIIASEQLDPDMLLVHAADFLTIGWMRRYCAVLHHRAAGAKSNVLVAWKVTQGDADYAGAVCARLRNISHCILRPPAKDWEYGLYTMIHGTTAQDCERAITEISNLTGLRDFTALWTTRQYRKRRIPLFGDHEKRWEENV